MNQGEYAKILETEETNWWYLSRRKLIRNYLEDHLSKNKQRPILDVACAAGTNFVKFSDYGKITGIDLSEESLEICRSRGIQDVICADATKLDFPPESFEMIFAFDALEHFDDDLAAIAGFSRVLKKNGLAVITVPAFMSLWGEHDEAYQHVRRYRRRELREKLEQFGFKVEFITYWSMTLFLPVLMFRKLRSLIKSQKSEAKSDFFQNIPRIAEKILSGIQHTESLLIRKKLSLPFGVSLFCIAKKL